MNLHDLRAAHAAGQAVVSIDEAHELLGISRATAYRLATANALPVPVLSLGRRRLLPVEPLLRLLEGLAEIPSASAGADLALGSPTRPAPADVPSCEPSSVVGQGIL